MARSEAKRQKKLAKKKAKRGEKRRDIASTQSIGLAERLGRLQAAPVLDCLVTEDFESEGIANLLIGRQAATGEVGVGMFLVDLYCLGVKDCMGKVTTFGEYRDFRENFASRGVRRIDPPSACRLINDAVEYASSLGFAPHPDFRRVQPILTGIDPAQARETFAMGKDGNPFYVCGPHDSATKSQRIIAQLDARCGRGGFHFLTPVGSVRQAGDGRVLVLR